MNQGILEVVVPKAEAAKTKGAHLYKVPIEEEQTAPFMNPK